MPIPKIIHYCWLSGDPFPPKIQHCVESWKKFLPDYELRLWNFERFPRGTSRWVDEAFDAKKYAFAADMIRFYAVYNHGGIYLDSDVEVVRSFNPLLNAPYFISFENIVAKQAEPAVFGAEKGMPWVGDCLAYYDNRPFVKEDGTYDDLVLPVLLKERVFNGKYDLLQVEKPEQVRVEPDKIFVFKREFSFSYDLFGKPGKDTYAIHHYNSSWMPRKNRMINAALAPIAKLLYHVVGAKCFHRIKGFQAKQ